MYYLPKYPNASGAYPGPRSNPEPDAWLLTDEQAQVVVDYNGFVAVSLGEDGAVTVEPDETAWEAWKAAEAESAKEPSTPPTVDEQIAALEAENKTLKAQVSAQSEQMDFYEECIAEMASVVYA